MGDFLKSEALRRSQDLEEFYRLNGAIYSFDINKLKERGEIVYTSESYAYVMENEVSQDIDTQLDFDVSEFILRKICA